MSSALVKYRWPCLGAMALLVASVAAVGMTWKAQHQSNSVAMAMTGGDLARAPDIIRRYGCAGCHTIPGIPGGAGKAGGPRGISNTASMSAASSPTRRTIWYDGSSRRKHFRRDRRCQQPESRKPKHGMLRPFSLRDEERSWLRRVAQGQRVDIGRNRVAIALRQHRCVGHNLGHGRTYTAVVRCLSRL